MTYLEVSAGKLQQIIMYVSQNRESLTWQNFEPQKLSVWLELYYVVIWVCVGDDSASASLQMMQKDAFLT